MEENNSTQSNEHDDLCGGECSPDCCKTCGRKLVNDEIAIYKRMVNRGATEYLCLTCFAAYYRVTEDLLREKIEHFREMGCTLFK